MTNRWQPIQERMEAESGNMWCEFSDRYRGVVGKTRIGGFFWLIFEPDSDEGEPARYKGFQDTKTETMLACENAWQKNP